MCAGRPKSEAGRQEKGVGMVKFLPAGECALAVECGNEINESINRQVRALYDQIQKGQLRGVTEAVPTFRSLLVYYDPCVISYGRLVRKLKRLVKKAGDIRETQPVIYEIPVCYGGGYGEDLAYVAEHAGITEEEVIRRHCGRDYRIYMLGFLPGFPYLGGMDESIVTPRLQNPRTRIPAGSVGIGGKQTGIYPIDSPGGWQLIGRTPLVLYDPNRESPILYQAGDYIRFCPVSPEEYERLKKEAEAGRLTVTTAKGGVRNGD